MIKIKFSKENTEFTKTLRERVKKELSHSSKYDHSKLMMAISLFLLIGIDFYLIISIKEPVLQFVLLTCLGFMLFLSGTYIIHEGTHGNISKKQSINKAFTNLFEIMACFSADQYRLRHLVVHHTYPNIGKFDYDLDTNGILRLSPAFERKAHHKYQWLYALPLYAIGIIHCLDRRPKKIIYF